MDEDREKPAALLELERAIAARDLARAESALRAGADPTAEPDGGDATMTRALLERDVPVALAIARAFPELLSRPCMSGRDASPLHMACAMAKGSALAIALAPLSDLSARDDRGRSALMVALSGRHGDDPSGFAAPEAILSELEARGERLEAAMQLAECRGAAIAALDVGSLFARLALRWIEPRLMAARERVELSQASDKPGLPASSAAPPRL